MVEASLQMQKYFEQIENGIKICYNIANKAREKGIDPDNQVEIPLARDMAERVEGLITVVAPQIKGSGVSQRIKELEKELGSQNWKVAFLISEEIAKEKFCKFKNKLEAMEIGLRAGLAYITNGVVSSPLEGFVRLELKKRKDGKEYFCLYFGGPIRSAGTTATCIFVAVADYIRLIMGYEKYDPTEEEIKRTFCELEYFHERITNLQYFPSEEEAEFMTRNLPVQIDGDASEEIDVPNYKDLARVSTNKLRNGFCLVMAEGLCQKFAKFWGKFSKWNNEMGMGYWSFLEDFVKLQKLIRAKGSIKKIEGVKIVPDYNYIKDLVAGRPILGYPLRTGAFRVRLGRARTIGLSDTAISPATMSILDDFIAYGTQLKTERPGKATTISSCDRIEGPIVKLKNGDVVFVENEKKAKEIKKDVEEIIFLGDILINYGYFLNRGHVLAPVGYSEDWWALELEKNSGDKKIDYKEIISDPGKYKPEFDFCYRLSKEFNIPLHPRFTYHWNDINLDELKKLLEWLKYSVITEEKIILPVIGIENNPKRLLELMGIPHKFANKEYVVIEGDWVKAFKISLGYVDKFDIEKILNEIKEDENVLDIINKISLVKIRDKSGLYIGSRMGRPEKSKMRELKGSPHGLFPVGEEGGRLRSLQEAIYKGKVTADFTNYYCEKCKTDVVYSKCHKCGEKCKLTYNCRTCDSKTGDCGHVTYPYSEKSINISEYYETAIKKLGIHNVPEIIKGIRGTANKMHIPEILEKGILRAVHDVRVNKDGTVRYDMTEMSATHFKPKEIGTSIENLKECGYTKDVYGNDLINEEQILELKCQDIILPACPESTDEGADKIFFRVANFIDDLLEKVYGLPRFYNIKKREDLVGHLLIGLSPHTAAGIVARIIGFSKVQVMLASPLMHSIMRRDCVHPKTKLLFFDKDNNLYYENIGSFVDKLISKGCEIKIIDLVGTKTVHPDKEYYSYSADPETKILIKRKIKYFIKGPIDKKWVKITTATNREHIMTLKHDFMYLDSENNIKSKKAEEISIGDKLLVMDYLKHDTKTYVQIDLIKEFIEKLPDNLKHNLKIVQSDLFFKDFVRKKGKKFVLDIIKTNSNLRKNLNKWYKAVPLDHIELLIKSGFLSYDNLPKNISLKYWFSDKIFPRFFTVGPPLLRLLGYYTAEGHCRENKTTRQVSFRICNPILVEKVIEYIKNSLNVYPNLDQDNTRINISYTIIYYLFKYVLETGSNAFNKQVPRIIYSLSETAIFEYVSGYIDGDGSVVPERKAIVLYSANRSLLDDFALLISKFHIIGRYQTTKERLPGKTLLERYEYLGKEPKKSIGHSLVFNGVDVLNLANKLNLYHPTKLIKLSYIINSDIKSRLLKFDNHLYPLHSFGDSFIDYVKRVEILEDEKNSYCVETEWNKKEERSVVWGEQIINFRCDADEACVMLLVDALINFSPKLLSNHRGATQDEPLVLSSMIVPTEVDDMVFDMDIAWRYPLELYEACMQYKPAHEVKIETLKSRLGTDKQYDGYGFTHDTEDFNNAVRCSRYKTIPTMQEKVEQQMILSEKIRAIDINDVARLIVERHFIRDIKGNLRKFSSQQFRCVGCNEKYRRPPLKGNCLECGGKLIFTISEGSVVKYLEPSLRLAEKYNLPPFLRQTLELTKQRIELVFGKEREKQVELNKWFA